ncbi:MAG: hypothetical protein ACE5ED_05720 [Rhodothalassiaceae bacterium]
MKEEKGDPAKGEQAQHKADWAGRPASFLIGWGIPMLAAFATNFIAMPMWAVTLVWMAAFAWMGTGCVLNARHCGRQHCIYSGPVLLLGAVAVALVGLEIVSLGRDAFIIVVWTTFAAVALTFVPEWIWGKYVQR